MFRIYMGAGFLIVFATVGGLTYSQASKHVEATARAEVEARVGHARSALERARRLQDFAVVAKAVEVARWPQIARILSTQIESMADAEGKLPSEDDFRYKLHQRMNEEVKVWDERFKALAKRKTGDGTTLADWRDRPDLFVVVDRAGVGVAHFKDAAWFGPREANLAKRFPVILRALKTGEPIQDIWIYGDAPMNVAVVPVKAGKAVGAVVLGYRLTDAAAKRDALLVGTEVAYFLGEHLSKTSTLDAGAEQELAAFLKKHKLFEDPASLKEPVMIPIGGDIHFALIGALAGNASGKNAGFLVLANLDQAVRQASSFVPSLVLLVGGGFFVAMLLLIILFQRHLHPFEEIDRGILEIINGDLDFWFEAKSDEDATKSITDSMAQNLNILVCHLSGRPLPDEDDLPGAEWEEERLFFDEALPADGEISSGGSRDLVMLAREDKETYHRRTFKEYTDGCRVTGEIVQGISYDKFISKLEASAGQLREKLGCEQVRFLVLIQEGRVALKPVPIGPGAAG